MTPVQPRDADKALAQLQMAELHNGLRGAAVPGWETRGYLPRHDYMAALTTTSPELAQTLELRMRAAKVPPPAASAKLWPKLEERLNAIADGKMTALVARERMKSPTTKLDEVLKRRGAAQRTH